MKPYTYFYYSLSEKKEQQSQKPYPIHLLQLAYIPNQRKVLRFTQRKPIPLSKKKQRDDHKYLGRFRNFVMLRYPSGYESPVHWQNQIPKNKRHHLESALSKIGLSQDELIKRWEDERRTRPFVDTNEFEPPSPTDQRLSNYLIMGIQL